LPERHIRQVAHPNVAANLLDSTCARDCLEIQIAGDAAEGELTYISNPGVRLDAAQIQMTANASGFKVALHGADLQTGQSQRPNIPFRSFDHYGRAKRYCQAQIIVALLYG